MTKSYKRVKAPENYPGRVHAWERRILESHFVWWQETGKVVPEGHVVHHKNENIHDNRFGNLELKRLGQHTRDHNQKHEDVVVECAWCGSHVALSGKYFSNRRGVGQKQFFCSSSHAALWGHHKNGKKPIPHGTSSGYSYHRCRCRLCRDAHAKRMMDYKKRKGTVAQREGACLASK